MTVFQNNTKELSLAWVLINESNGLPKNAIDFDTGLYLIRTQERNSVLPGQWIRNAHCSVVSIYGIETKPTMFEILCDTKMWRAKPA